MKKINKKKNIYIAICIVITVLSFWMIFRWGSLGGIYSYNIYYADSLKYFMLCLVNHNASTNNVFPVDRTFEFDKDFYDFMISNNHLENHGVFFSEDYRPDQWNNNYLIRINQSEATNKYQIMVWSKGPNKKNDNGKKDDIISTEEYVFKKWRRRVMIPLY